MRKPGFWISWLLLLAAQIVLCDCFAVSQLLSLWFLPMMVLCIPVRFDTPRTLLVAFAAGMAVDFLSQGVPGLCTVALLPVALLRVPIIRLVFGEEVFSRGEDISFRRQGLAKMALGIVIATALFLLVYIWADGAFTRPFWFNAGRFLLSLLLDSAVALLLVSILSPDEGPRWK